MTSPREAFTKAGFEPVLVRVPPPEHDPTLSLEIYVHRYRHSSPSAGSSSSSSSSPEKEPLLLLHGHPQNSIIYHRIAPDLVKKAGRDIVLADLRGHGHSGVPKVQNYQHGDEEMDSTRDTRPSAEALKWRYSKREMARDNVMVMKHLGYERFSVVGHDRGGRVAHRMALDWPEVVVKIMLLDIAPTYDLYDLARSSFATFYWHWFFLIQPYPFPEQMLLANPSAYLGKMLGRFPGNQRSKSGDKDKDDDDDDEKETFPRQVIDSYTRQLSSPPRAHATCEDYRASAPGGVDLTLDLQDRNAGRKVKQPVSVLWGDRGVNEGLFGHDRMLALWKNVCDNVDGHALKDCGHYVPEEVPGQLQDEILAFF